MTDFRNFIDGRWVETGKTFDNRDPVDNRLIGRVHEAGDAEVDAAVRAAKAALRGPWGALKTQQRVELLHAVADGITRRFDDFVDAEIADTGKPYDLANHLDIPRGAANFKIFADLIRNVPNETFDLETPDGGHALIYGVRVPRGVIGVICPWNLPLLLLTWKVAPALAFGNTVVMKPSEVTPSTATLLAEVADQAGLPAGVLNLTHGFGPGSAGEFLTTHPDIDGITFTGESATGATIMRAVAPGVKPVSFELGGKNAALVFADADFDAAVDGVTRSVFANCGQVCLCTERVYVERPIYERFVAALAARARDMRIGWPLDPATEMGPLVSREHREKVLSYFALAREEGATVVAGGGVPVFGDARDAGAYVQPTIWTGLKEDARCIKEEVFGPVCHVAPFDTEEEAIRLANDTRYGLAAAVWTQNLTRGHRVAQAMKVGLAWRTVRHRP
ncbi:hypothetical protein G6F57_015389 [Rhizopus arrhizus]|nr:hypothetical protein G6F57_015389 [Rhizopus arrhizus]